METFKYVLLLLMAYGIVETGMVVATLGETLLDLQHLYNASFHEVSLLFVAYGVGVVSACLVMVVFLNKSNIHPMMIVSGVMFTLGAPMIAATGSLSVGLVCILVTGAACGIMTCDIYATVKLLFPGKAYLLHFMAWACSVSSVLSSLVAKPFLGEIKKKEDNPFKVPESQAFIEWTTEGFDSAFSTTSQNEFHSSVEIQSSHITYLCVLFGLTCVPLIPAFVLVFLKSKNNEDLIYQAIDNDPNVNRNKPAKAEIVFLSTVMALCSTAFGLPFAFGSYITETTVRGYHHFSIQKAATATMSFWLAFTLGRVSAFGLSLCAGQTVVMCACLCGTAAATGLLLLSEWLHEAFFWAGMCAFGFSQGPLFATVMAWSGEYIALTPRIFSLFIVAEFIGTTLIVYLDELLIESYNFSSHIYNVCLVLIQFLLFLSAYITGKCYLL